jgi:hypothetical protein
MMLTHWIVLYDVAYTARRSQYSERVEKGRVRASVPRRPSPTEKLQTIRRTHDPQATFVQNVSVYHRRPKAVVAEKLLDGANV